MKIKIITLMLVLAIANSFHPLISPALRTRDQSNLFAYTPKEEGKLLRREIAERNTVVKDEGKYSLRDGEGMQGVFVSEPTSQEVSAADTNASTLAAKLERMLKPRAYPLFLAEKAAEILEHTFQEIVKGSSEIVRPNLTKERLVVLGTGWGAASFLKDIDTTMYDVTVISPRNYFLFTPMLAGSSVGTVEYRSITEPIREVSFIVSSFLFRMSCTHQDVD